MAGTYDKTFISTEAKPAQRKRLVVCCDGTWQSATSTDIKHACQSNVARISRVLAKAGVDRNGTAWQQVVYYDAGVGTGALTEANILLQGDPTSKNLWLRSILTRTFKAAKGLGLLENVLEAYNFIVCNYTAGDELFFFGFSRGAYTVRAAAGIVQQIGIIQPWLMPKFLKLFGTYIKAQELLEKPQLLDQTDGWRQFCKDYPDCLVSSREKTVIQVIGVWDTVGALGVPDINLGFLKVDSSRLRKAYQFYNTHLGPGVKHAYQALALDELRVPFSPCLWQVENGNKETSLVQCWFPGAHINVGGGNSVNADEKHPNAEQMASIAYAWMLDRVRPWLALDEKALDAQKAEMEKLMTHSAPISELDDWFWGEIDKSYTAEYRLTGPPTPRTPTAYFDHNNGWTVERVHPTVWLRKKHEESLLKTYSPAAMSGWERIWVDDGHGKDMKPRKGWKWVKFQKNGPMDASGKPKWEKSMWEFEVGHMPGSVEQWLIKKSGLVSNKHDEIELGWRSQGPRL